MNCLNTLFLFIFISLDSMISAFKFCSSDSFCYQTLLALDDISNAFVYASFLKEDWKRTKHFCSWACIKCDSVKNVIVINFRKLKLMGTISSAFYNIHYLESLIIDQNNLTGQVPVNLTRMNFLRHLDISNNNISGILPNFSSYVKVKAYGNPLLQIRGSSPNIIVQKNEKRISAIIIVLVPIMFIVAVLIFGLIKFYTYNPPPQPKRAQSDMKNERVVQVVMNKSESVIFSIQLLRQATENFAKDKIIGRGGCGIVYKGELDDGSKLAIKKMNYQALESRGLNEFQAEIDVLTRVRHRHLVSLFAYCADGNEKYLVYEYMTQGTLAQHLFNWQHNGYHPLTWSQRIVIALDVAKGIEYLHNQAIQSFIHRDLKPSNILLDNDLRAKVADFGLVKNVPLEQSLETRLAGTFGYLAPEYGATGRVTTKIDVYAFGAILMEIVTGRKALDNSLGDDQSHLVSWFRRTLMKNENIKDVIDLTLRLNKKTLDSIQKVVDLAIHCTTLERYQRPDMNYVVNILDSLVNLWIPTFYIEDRVED